MAVKIRFRMTRRVWLSAALAVVGVLGAVVGADAWVSRSSREYLFSPQQVPDRPVALVLGALEVDGKPSLFLAARLDVAKDLYERGLVRAILVSGDNGRPDYDEPTSGRNYLIERGVPAESIALDYAGFSTYDSCVRAKEIFGVTELTVVTQNYHLPRAVTICRSIGIDAVGAGTDAHEDTSWGRVADTRELLANVKAGLDLTLETTPRFLGPPEPGVRAALAAGR
jgi:vancomycin permeability regulator SanA